MWSTDLWDGFEVIKNATLDGAHLSEELGNYIKKLASLSNQYGKAMQSLAKSTLKQPSGAPPSHATLSAEHTYPTLYTAVSGIVELTDWIGRVFVEFSEELDKSPHAIDDFLAKTRKNQKQLVNNGQKLVQEVAKAEYNCSKAKGKFYSLKKKQDESLEEYNRAKSSQTANIVAKLGKKADENAKAAEKADKEYQKNVEILRNIQEKTFRVDMPKIINDIQDMEEQRIDNLTQFFTTVHSIHERVVPKLSKGCDTFNNSVQGVDVAADIQSFADRYKSGKSISSRMAVYEAYDSTVAYGATISEAATNSNVPTITAPSPKSEQVITLYEYAANDENELSFKPNEVITVLHKLPGGWWQGQLNGKIGMFPSNYVEPVTKGNLKDSADSRSLADSNASGASDSSPDISSLPKYKVLYAFVGEEEEELSVTLGEILHKESETENGWSFVFNESGQYGRVPSAYIQIVP